MALEASNKTEPGERKTIGFFERYLSVWVILCIGGGILLGKVAPGAAQTLDQMAIRVSGAPVVSIPIAICLFLMMYPALLNLDDRIPELARPIVEFIGGCDERTSAPIVSTLLPEEPVLEQGSKPGFSPGLLECR